MTAKSFCGNNTTVVFSDVSELALFLVGVSMVVRWYSVLGLKRGHFPKSNDCHDLYCQLCNQTVAHLQVSLCGGTTGETANSPQ